MTRTTSPAGPPSRRSASPATSVPPTAISMTSGPSMALTSPPASAHPAAVAAAHSPRWISSTSSKQVLAARTERGRAPRRCRPHCGQVGERDRQRSGAETARGDPGSAEIDALDQGILADRDVDARASGDHTAASSPEPITRARDVVLAISASALSKAGSPTSARVAPAFVEAPFGHPVFHQRHTSAIYVAHPRGTVLADGRACVRTTKLAMVRRGCPSDTYWAQAADG